MMTKKMNDYRYSRIATLSGIRAEKERLRRKARKQEKKLANDWEQIEESWQVVNKIASLGGRLFSSASLIGAAELGYKIVSHFFPRKKAAK